jgi:integral membrane sensor domain MASE1
LDALKRAVRTFVAGLLGTCWAAALAALTTLLAGGHIRFTREYYLGALAAVAAAVLAAATSYVMRYTHPPKE